MSKKAKVRKVDVSVIVPMYNVENLIAETIQSLKNNECNFEVILVNDGSTDNTLQNARKCIDTDSRFIILDQENQGVSVARNNGLLSAKGKYISFVDADDVMINGSLDILLSAALYFNADYVYGRIQKFNKTRKWAVSAHEQYNVFEEGFKTILDNPELYYSLGLHGKLFSRKLFGKSDIFKSDIKYAEDQLVIFEILSKANKIYSVGKDVYLYRERDLEDSSELSVMQQKDERAYEFFINMINVIRGITIINERSLLPQELKNKNLSNYYGRAIKFDIWPLMIRILRYHPSKSAESFYELIELIKVQDKDFISSISEFRYFFIKVLSDNVFYIKNINGFIAYREFLACLFDRFNENVYKYFSKPTHYGKRWDDSLFLAKSNVIKAYCYFLYLRPKKKVCASINKNKVRLIKKYWFPLCKLLPKQKNKVIFASTSPKPMGENFNHIINQLRKNHQLDHFKIYKFLGSTNSTKKLLFRYFHSATARTIFLENYYNPYYELKFSKKTNVVQLWHACGAFKQFAHDALNQKDSNTLEFENNAHSFYTHVSVSSEGVQENYSSAFDLPNSKILSLGVPRTDVFFDDKKISRLKQKILKKYPYLSFTKNILYAPTFRGSPSERKKFNLPIDWNQLKNIPRNYKLIIKLHPVVEQIYPEIPDWIKDRVLVLNAKENVNDWMLFCDVLVTDYSSLIFEYSLLNKPIVHYPFDLEEYFDERGFYYPYDTYVYGEVVYTSEELVQAILNAEIKHESFYEVKETFKKKFMGNCDGNASQRIIQHFLKK